MSDDVAKLTQSLATRLGGFAQVGRRLGVTGRAVQNYAEGKRAPRPAVAAKIVALARQGGKDAPARPSTPPRPPDASKPRTAHPRVAAGAPSIEQQEALVRDLDELLVAALADPTAGYRDRASVANAKDRALRTLSDMRGERAITEPAILRSKAFGRIFGVITEALASHLAAATAVALALEALEGETSE